MTETIATYPSLANKVVLITGGSSGIGESIVRHFATQGSKVGFIDIDAARGEALRTELADRVEIAFEACDIRDVEALRTAIDKLRQRLGPISVLINNAGHDQRHDWKDVTSEMWDDRYAVNLKHQFFAAQAVVPDMQAQGGGVVINLGSISWMISQGGMPAYTSAKAAIGGLTRTMARDFGPYNIRVCCVAPGWIITPRQKELWLTPEAEADLLRSQSLKRKLLPADIARPVLFFASDEAGACTGQTYIVDGGWA